MNTPTLNEGYRYECKSWNEDVPPVAERHQSLDCRSLNVWTTPPREIIEKMIAIGAKHLSGAFIYKPGDFQGWHTNGNALGQRVYISWAEEANMSGMRFFIDGQVVESPDTGGWCLRAFTPPVWHGVYANCVRASVGFLFPEASPFGVDIIQPIKIEKLDDIERVASQ